MPGQATLLTGLVLSFIGAVWATICVLGAQIGGWSRLATVYSAWFPASGPRWRFQDAQLRYGMGYGMCVTVTVAPEGLGLAVMPFLRLGHPPLLIPWEDVSARRERNFFGGERVLLTFAQEPSVPVRIRRRLAERIEAEVGPLPS